MSMANSDAGVLESLFGSAYRLVLIPAVFAVLLLIVGAAFQTAGWGIEAGLAGALAVYVVAIAVMLDLVLWLIGKVGY